MRWILPLVLLATPAFAQQQAPSPSEQALSAKLGAEIGLGLKCSADLLVLQQQLAQAQVRLKELEGDHK